MKRWPCIVLCFVLVLTSASAVRANRSIPEEWSKPKAVVWAASDFQYPNSIWQGKTYENSYAAGAAVMSWQLQSLKKDYPAIDEALFLGDYEPSFYTNRPDGINAVKSVIRKTWNLEDHRIQLLQGNHDHYDTPGLSDAQLVFTPIHNYDSKSGRGYIVPVERQDYSLCLIHEDAFPETFLTDTPAVRTLKRQTVKETAVSLKKYLTKTLAGSSKPVIVLGHLPLHYSRQDNLYARDLVDALNAGAAAGRTLIYLFGHNHSAGYDNYMGGSCIYYPAGSAMLIPDAAEAEKGKNAANSMICNFTYLNAGYMGFTGTTEPGATLSSTILEIYEDRVELIRYNANGVIPLKNQGIKNTAGVNLSVAADPQILPSPQRVGFAGELTVSVSKEPRTTIAPGTADYVNLKVSGAVGEVDVRWQTGDSSVVSVTGQGTTARIMGNGCGTACLRAKVTDSTGKCTVVYLDVTVCPDEAVTYPQTAQTLYRLVTDWNTIRPGVEYIILNTDGGEPPTAFAGADAKGNRVKNGTLSKLVTHPQLWHLTQEAVFISNTHDYDHWQFQIWPHEAPAPEGEYLLQSQNQVYVGASNHLDPAVKGYKDATGLYMGSNINSAGTIGWVVDRENRRLEMACYRTGGDSAQSFTRKEGYGLYYDRQQDCFTLAQSGDPVYLYEKVDFDFSQVRLWVQGQGNLISGQTDTGASVMVLAYDRLSSVPLTVDMLSGMDLTIPGSGICTVTWQGLELTRQFPLTIWDPSAKTPVKTISIQQLYRPAKTLRPGRQYAFFSTLRQGQGYALSMEPMQWGILSTVARADIFTMEDEIWAAVEDTGCGFAAQRAKPDPGRFLLKSNTGYLHTIKGSRLNLHSSPLTCDTWTASGNGVSNGKYGLCFAGAVFFPGTKGSTAHLYEYDPDSKLVTQGYLTAVEGRVQARDFDGPMYPGGQLVLVRRLSNDGREVSVTQIPITVTMLRGITLRELMTPGTYHGSIWYGTTQLCEDYTLTVT